MTKHKDDTTSSESPESNDVTGKHRANFKFAELEKKTKYKRTDDMEEEEVAKVHGGSEMQMTPLEASQNKQAQKSAECDESLKKLFDLLRWLIPVIVTIGTAVGIFFLGSWVSKIEKLSVPMGELQKEVSDIKNTDIRNLREDLKKVDDRIYNFRTNSQ